MLQAIAYKMVGCIHDAQDIVQDTFYKYLTIDRSKIENPKAYLIKSVTNNCINHLNSSKESKKEFLEGVKFSEIFEKIDLSHLDLKQELTAALEVLHKKLGPLERGLFLLREGFDFDYEDLQSIFNKKKENCRQMVCRAKEKLAKETEKFNSNFDFDVDAYFTAINKASQQGDFQELMDRIFETGPSSEEKK